MIEKLSQEIVNQIAAGEVIERPASVVKELLDNAIDAKASKIDIKLKQGGIKHIEIGDNGFGISEEDLPKATQAHATSKIKSLEDLNELISMGFRGEALSTIVAVSETSIVSKEKNAEFGYKIDAKGIKTSVPQKSPRDVGTTVVVQNIFKEIPARLKYLRAESTEYRKVLEILTPYFLIYPEIHFTLSHNDRQVYNLPAVKDLNTRIANVLKSDFTKDMLPLFFDGEGMKIFGYVAQPKYNYARTIHQYIFVNKRPIQDKGIIRAVFEGFSGFIPDRSKVPFVLNLEIKPSLVDINVHPKKEEIRLMNPYRVYSAVEESIKQALKQYSNKSMEPVENLTFYDKPKEVNYRQQSQYSVKSGLEFSKHLLQSKNTPTNLFQTPPQDESSSFSQIFNKYILAQFENEIWIIDQHAASERISYERIQNQFEKKAVEIQNLLIPIDVQLSDVELLFIQENEKVFNEFGFNFKINKNIVEISEVPSMLIGIDLEEFLKDLIADTDTAKDIKKIQDEMISTIACHASIRTGQRLDVNEMRNIIKQLKQCSNSTSCPHGRPIIWKLTEKELDKHFYRTS